MVMYDLDRMSGYVALPSDTYQIIIILPKFFGDQPDRLVLFGSQTFDSTPVLIYCRIECQINFLLLLHCTIWCRSTFGPRGPGLSNPTSFLRPALPMAPTTDDNARDKRSVLRPNPATFLRDFTLYMMTNYASIRKRCLNYNACITH